MTLFRIIVTQTRLTNGIRLEKGMSVEVASAYSNPLTTNGGHEVVAFQRVYGIDLQKAGKSGLDVKKIN